MAKIYDRDYQFVDTNGDPLASGSLEFLLPGTSTQTAVYSDSALTTSLGATVDLGAGGRPESSGSPVDVYGIGLVDVRIKNSAGTVLLTVENKGQAVENQVVATIAALKALPAPSNNNYRVSVLGYTAAGDGGAGTFYYDSSDTSTADNGGTVIVGDDTTTRWKLVHNGEVTFRQFAAKGDDSNNDQSAIAAGITASVSEGFTLRGTPGNYRIGSSLTMVSSLKLVMDPGCVIKRNFATSATTLTQSTPGTPLTNVWIEGGHITTVSSSMTGPAVFLHADDSMLHNIRVTEFYDGGSGGQAFVIGGDRLKVINCSAITADTSTGTGAFRYFGGTDFLGANLYAECADDCFQFVPVAETSPYGDLSILRGRYVNCWGISNGARVCIAAIANPNTTDQMTCSILDSAFIGCGGKGKIRCVYVDNQDSSGHVRRIKFQGCQWDGTANATVDDEILVTSTNGVSGEVTDIEFIGCDIISPRRGALKVSGADRVHWIGGTLGAPRSGTSGISQVLFQDCQDCYIDGATVYLGASVSDGIHLGVSSNLATRCHARNNTVLEVTDGQLGIRDAYGVDCHIVGNTIMPASGETTGTGISVASTASGTHIERNDASNIGGTEYSINATGDPVFIRNKGIGSREAGKATLSSGSVAVSFKDTFLTAAYSIQLSGAANETFYWSSPTTSGFTINSSNGSSTATVSWEAAIEDV